ncbi:MAG: PadR family transcriptional regulator [Thermomicrobiales bacterium]
MSQKSQSPLAMSILSFLRERPMHPYEIKHMMQVRHHDQVFKLTGGSLYSTINRLEAQGHISPLKTERSGKRPERTTYQLTPEGESELLDWLRQAVAEPFPEYSNFGAVIAFLPHLMPSEVLELLVMRLAALGRNEQEAEREMQNEFWSTIPSMFKLHARYAATLRQAEIEWITTLVADIESGQIAWPKVIVDWHKRRGSWTEEAIASN